ncbi:MAG: methyltransferase [Pseudomonadota bacterium]
MTGPETLTPGKLLGISGAYWQTCTLHAAVKLDVVTAMGEGPVPAAVLAGKIDADPRALAMLLDALCAMDILSKSGNDYAPTQPALKFLSKASDGYIGHMIMHHHHLVESWSKMDQAVKTGKPVRTRSSFDDAEYRESFLMGMFNNAMGMVNQLVPTLDLSGRKHLLDLGGGPGTYAIHFCKYNPGLRATIYDLPTTRPFAEKTIHRFGQGDAVTFLDGDYIKDPVPGSYDVVWLSHILHGEGPVDCQRIVDKAVNALAAGGMIIIHEFILNPERSGPLFPALFSLNMLLGTESGQSYSETELAGMLTLAGIGSITRTGFKGPTESGILLGVKP